MAGHLIKKATPEERELERKQQGLQRLLDILADRELELATRQAELAQFNLAYYNAVGRLYVELDALEAQIAELMASQSPTDQQAQKKATEARARAAESAREGSTLEERKTLPRFDPSQVLKSLFREVAKLLHPDLATNEEDKARRHELMIRANRAYEHGDEIALRAILAEWHISPDSVEGDDTGAELVRVIRRIAQVEARLAAIDQEISNLAASELSVLKAKVEEARKQDRDLLGEMAQTVNRQLIEARTQLERLQTRPAPANTNV